MANSLFITFLLLILVSSPLILQIQARDSQFFSKVTTTTQPTQTPTQTAVLPDKEKEQQSLVNPEKEKETEQPEFVPQNENGYGLYGHETGLNAPEIDASETYSSEKYYSNDKDDAFTGEKFDTTSSETEKDDLLNFDDAFDTNKYGNGETFYSNNNNGVDDNREDVRFGSQTESESYYKDNRFDNRFTDDVNSRYESYRGESNAERKGMSDTRFLENGKYYYDLEKEQDKYNNRRNTYNNRAYESNEVVGNGQYDGASYDNSGADKYEFNTMEEYEKSRLNQYDP